MNLAVATHVMARHNLTNIKVAAPSGIDLPGLSFAVRKDWPEFVSILNKAMASITTEEETAIRSKWISVRYEALTDRSALIRVPMYKPGKEAATRIELRCPDPAANPYLAFAVMLAAGLKGIEEGYSLPESVEEDIFEMGPAELDKYGIDSLPGSLYEAAKALEGSALMKETLGESLHTNLVANKMHEWDEYRTHVSEFELEKYLPLL